MLDHIEGKEKQGAAAEKGGGERGERRGADLRKRERTRSVRAKGEEREYEFERERGK